MMNNVLCNPYEPNYKCTGCGACALACPLGCIHIEMNEEGFLQPAIENNRCTACGKCMKVCHMYAHDTSQNDLFENCTVYAAIAHDNELLRTVSSGGVSAVLLEYAFAHGYSVCGVVFDISSNKCHHIIAQNKEDLERIKTSKYMQSATLPAFSLFKKGKKYMVVGTPCQIDGLNRWAIQQNRREDFLLIDLFCKGVPSYLQWVSYLKYLEEKHGFGKLRSVQFRDKRISWHKYSFTIIDEYGKEYSETIYSDLYAQCFIKSICYMPACYPCTFRHHESAADLRLADFWGATYYDHEKGVSMVITFTDAGEKMLTQIHDKLWIERCDPKLVKESQRFDIIPMFEERNAFLEALKTGIPLDKAYQDFRIDQISLRTLRRG